ncbi:hypothetical protein [Streptomyces sp. NPDC013187]|uniref:hypothetical protein n=1 Tax=Streptomyces sp. NPDC013187 TaxID=3364865 RepID=UPI0036C17D83
MQLTQIKKSGIQALVVAAFTAGALFTSAAVADQAHAAENSVVAVTEEVDPWSNGGARGEGVDPWSGVAAGGDVDPWSGVAAGGEVDPWSGVAAGGEVDPWSGVAAGGDVDPWS